MHHANNANLNRYETMDILHLQRKTKEIPKNLRQP